MNINDASSLDLSTGMTLEAWVYPTSSTGWRTVIMKERTNGMTYALYAQNNASRPAVHLRIGSSDRTLTGPSSLPLNQWSHLAATYNGTSLLLYVNGSQVASLAVTGSITVSSRPLRIGGSSTLSTRYFSGRIDEVRIYNRALTQTEIQTDMNTSISPPDTTPPTDPTNLTATPAGSTQINLSWTASTDNVAVTGYQIERCQGTGCTTFALLTTVTGTTYNNTGLTASTPYSYRVRATDGPNFSGYSNTASATTQAASDTTPPTDPTNLTATPAGSTQINLSWTASTDNIAVTGYQIERCQGTGCTAFALLTTVTGTTYNNTGLTASTPYSYRVRATDGTNFSGYSNTASATTQAASDTTPPTDPTNLTATPAGSTQINLSWTASTDNIAVTGYQIERCQGTGCTTFALLTTVTGTTYNNTGLTASTPYSYRVRATDGPNFSGYSNTASATTQASGTCTSLVLVNSSSPDYGDFQHFIQPHLDNVGIPYSVLNIATTPVSTDIGSCAVIIIGHSQLDVGATYLDATEQGYISAAVNAGTGLVNFDNVLDNAGTPRYTYVQTIFNFGYGGTKSGSNVTFPSPAGHYITKQHGTGETISTSSMTLAGITGATSLATTGSQPFLAVTTYGSGHAVQWGSYDWMSHSVLGPLFGLDDLVWRSIVWAARKPFVMQGLPPFVTMRMDDVIDPSWWIDSAYNEAGFIPWVGIFTDDIDSTEAAKLSSLAASGKATVALHAFGTSNFFYFDHYSGANFSDGTMDNHFT